MLFRSEVTDLEMVKKMFTSFTVSLSRISDNGEGRATLSFNADGTITAVFDSSETEGDQIRNAPVALSDVQSAAVGYEIGDVSYRMGFAND